MTAHASALQVVSDHRCEPGLKVIDPACTWHHEHYWCSWCQGFYGVPHDPGGCHSQPEPWYGGPASASCACRFCHLMKSAERIV